MPGRPPSNAPAQPSGAARPASPGKQAYEARRAVIDGLEYRECFNVVAITGGIAGNVIPDRASATLNYRFAPDTSVEQAEAHVREVLAGLDLEIEVTDSAPGALPGLDTSAAQDFLAALGGEVPLAAKQGWTDVSRFSALGTPAVNFGPGDPLLAHTDDEHVPVDDLAPTGTPGRQPDSMSPPGAASL